MKHSLLVAIPEQLSGTYALIMMLGVILSLINLGAAFMSERRNMWWECALIGFIAGALSAWFDWTLIHSGGAYANVANNPGLMALTLILDFILAIVKALAICGFAWVCRWLFIWRRQKNHPGVTLL